MSAVQASIQVWFGKKCAYRINECLLREHLGPSFYKMLFVFVKLFFAFLRFSLFFEAFLVFLSASWIFFDVHELRFFPFNWSHFQAFSNFPGAFRGQGRKRLEKAFGGWGPAPWVPRTVVREMGPWLAMAPSLDRAMALRTVSLKAGKFHPQKHEVELFFAVLSGKLTCEFALKKLCQKRYLHRFFEMVLCFSCAKANRKGEKRRQSG